MKKIVRKIIRGFSFLSQIILHLGRKHGICFSSNTKKLYGYMNKYNGERCFVIGNGPSLRASDLDTLKNEYTFGSNMIYKIYDQTSWRPTFHASIDLICAQQLSNEYKRHISCPLFTNQTVYNVLQEKPKDTIFVRDYFRKSHPVSKRFLSYYYPSGATVTAFILELAIFMGFREIYLLGVDCTNTFGANAHFTDDYVSKEITEKDISRIYKELNRTNTKTSVEAAAGYSIDMSIRAYKKIDTFSKTKGTTIYNATRGGALEVFERVDFDEIIKK